MFTIQFWKDAGERAARTAAQTAATALGGDVVNIWTVDWQTIVGLSGGAAALSLLMSLGAAKVGDSGTASYAKAAPDPSDEKR